MAENVAYVRKNLQETRQQSMKSFLQEESLLSRGNCKCEGYMENGLSKVVCSTSSQTGKIRSGEQ